MRSRLFDERFDTVLMRLREEGRYRVSCELETLLGALPRANWRDAGSVREVVTWCSNDYLGMSQHPQVLAAPRGRSAPPIACCANSAITCSPSTTRRCRRAPNDCASHPARITPTI